MNCGTKLFFPNIDVVERLFLLLMVGDLALISEETFVALGKTLRRELCGDLEMGV